MTAIRLFLCAAVSAAFFAQPHPASGNEHLHGELAGLLAAHPGVAASKKNLDASRKGVDKALSGYWPKVSLNADAGPENISTPATRAAGKDWQRTRNIAGLTVTQNLFNGFATQSAVRTAELNSEIAAVNVDSIRQATLFEATTAYIDVLRQKRLIELAREAEGNVQRQLQLEDERVRRGSGVAVDVLEAKRRLQSAKERRVGFEGGLQNAISRYLQIFDHAPDIEAMIDPVPPIELIPAELDQAVEIAMGENPAIASASHSVDAAEENRRAVNSEYAPKVDLVGKWNHEKHRNLVPGSREDYSLVVQASWDLFSGFSTKSESERAAHLAGASKDNHLQTGRKVEEQTRLAWQALLTARERMVLLENAVNIAHEVWTSRQALREAGKETVINVLDAENELSNAQINFTAATYDERVAVYQLLLSMGRLDPGYLGFSE